ncbi:hypothetical protein V3C99_015891, partial [Haemonchus contortus]
PAVLRDYAETRQLNMRRNGVIVVHKNVQRTVQLNPIVIAQQMCAPQLPILHNRCSCRRRPEATAKPEEDEERAAVISNST